MILDKAKMAHDYLLKLMETNPKLNAKYATEFVWEMVDAMQAEADKRNKAEAEQKRKAIREMINADNTFLEKEGQHFDDVEWQPDWSQAPSWANLWVAIANSKGEISGGWFFSKEPEIGKGDGVSVYYDGGDSTLTGSFGYQGNWQDSLRKRPQ